MNAHTDDFTAAMRVCLDERLAQIERALKLDPDKDYRRQLVREYLRLTEPKKEST